MPSRDDVHYFGAGPAPLPTAVLERASSALLNYQDTGLGIAEHSHRSELASNILNTAKADLASFLNVPDDYDILFMQGGGSGEFSATVYNLVGAWVTRKKAEIARSLGLDADKDVNDEKLVAALKSAVESELKLDYLVTGSWSLKAYKEAGRLIGEEYTNLAADARKVNGGKFGKIPDENSWSLSKNPAMVYFCDNETVDAVEFPSFPESLNAETDGSKPIVVADMSSNILSRRIPIKNYSVIFFGAQKNLGSTGITVVIIKKSLMPPACPQPPASLMRKLGLPVAPVVLSYETIAANNSLYNTLSIFDVYVAGQVLKELLAKYPEDKIEGQEAESNRRAAAIYGVLEKHSSMYKIVPDKSVRSRMNICFRVSRGGETEQTEKEFLKQASNWKSNASLTGLKGHRSVGGIRISNYNAIRDGATEELVEFLDKFAQS
ncbi:pyridoxal phosphate-dependent transferase [Microdochium bolleyi]|uniref:phosphoserine transaminase n=1 Tax=Microdochium bolleyi TaxID=196109 RepID=A0A136J6V5_9PEZI|nr:pyridoxal phosphate-dependent transferase [Microdochium bolleyi]